MVITSEILQSLIQCEYKGYLKFQGKDGIKTDFEKLNAEIKNTASKRFENKQKKIISCKKPFNIYDYQENDIIKNVVLKNEIFHINLEFLKVLKDRKTRRLHVVPLTITYHEKINQKLKLFQTFLLDFINNSTEFQANYGLIILGKELKPTKVYYKHSPELNRLKGRIDNIDESTLFISNQCSACEFKQHCIDIAKKEDSLCQIGGISKTDIRKKNERGIFTLTQLSYTFRPRRNRKRKKANSKKRKIELQALTLRENKIHIYEFPEIYKNNIEIYLDIEGLPEENFYYLIGVVIKKDKKVYRKSFWADSKEFEIDIFCDFLKSIKGFGEYTMFHYGNYEIKALKTIQKRIATEYHNQIEKLISNSQNILTAINSSVYFPIFQYSLKNIAKFIGFSWSENDASGLQSIVWRKRWEVENEENYKRKLITYNIEDCLALFQVKEYLENLLDKSNKQSDVIYPEHFVKKTFALNFMFGNYSLPEIKEIHEHSSFDYQKERVFVNSHKRDYKTIKSRKKHKRQKYRNNTIVYKKSLKCPFCKSKSQLQKRGLKKKVVDLKITATGIKRWIIEYRTHKHYCPSCKRIYIPPTYLAINTKYGHSLVSYTLFQNIENRESYRQISNNLLELFDLNIGSTTINDFKIKMANYYQSTFKIIKTRLLNSPILYVDETPISMRFENGYIWVLSNNSEVICFYQSTREAVFIRDLLSNFKGVLVTDFYTAYDTIECTHQKCLLHLIRDLNDDLIKYPFNDELKSITQQFSKLMQEIVKTIDKYGLKKYHLSKHISSANTFIQKVINANYRSEIGLHYQKRIKRYEHKLFVFLKYDNLSWNNNIAEFAIKKLAIHQNKNQMFFRKSRIDDYLVIMSVFITCKFKNISFLKFLVSQKKSLWKE